MAFTLPLTLNGELQAAANDPAGTPFPLTYKWSAVVESTYF